ncbi:MAG TPA: PDZ domain-containing protein [Chthonomonadaceae bacterium]|nr:PDZ domain-containing protein [Chthonomonadaceae bacterium]
MLIGIIVFMIVILFVCAVWGREAAQGCFWTGVTLAAVFFLLVLGGFFWLVGTASREANEHEQQVAASTSRTRIGIGELALAPSTASMYGLPSGAGIYVQSVEPGSPAAVAGIQVGDCVLAANGTIVGPAFDLNAAKAGMSPGMVITIRIGRGGQVYDVPITLASAP